VEPQEKEEIRARINIVEFISGYTPLKRAGRDYKGLCPFHREKTPSFTVNPDMGSWHCWGACGTGGDIFAFLMKVENLSFFEAAEQLAERAGVTLTKTGVDAEQSQRFREERERLYGVNALSQRFFKESLRRSGVAIEYVKSRQLTPQILADFGVGFSPDSFDALTTYLRGQRLDLKEAEEAGLIYISQKGNNWVERFRGRLIFPIIDTQEQVIGFGGRLIPGIATYGTPPKYVNSPETPVFSKSKTLYGLNKARKAIVAADSVLLVEGYMDVIAAHQAGITNVVATLGTAFTADHLRLLRRYTKNIILSFDSDTAGINAALRASETVTQMGEEIMLRVLTLPKGDDPDAMLMRGDIAVFRRQMEGAITIPEFRLRGLEEQFDLGQDQGRIAFLREAVAIVAEVPSALEQDLLVRRLAGFHPAGGERAEVSLRAEIVQYQQRLAPKLQQKEKRENGAFTGYNRTEPSTDARNNTGSAGQKGEGQWQKKESLWEQTPEGKWRKKPASRPPQPEEPLPISLQWGRLTRAERAEHTLLRGLFHEEWRNGVIATIIAHPEWLLSDRSRSLLEAAQTLRAAGFSAEGMRHEITDMILSSWLTELLMGDTLEEPFSEPMLTDCWQVLQKAWETKQAHQLNTSEAEEDILRGFEKMKTMKNPPAK
jgi:DNA primase